MMSQGGEFAFVVAADATAKGLFSTELAHQVLLIVSLTMFAAPVVARVGHVIGRWWDHHHHPMEARLELAELVPLEGHIIIVGFGRMGQLVAEVLTSQKIHYLAIDIDMMRSTKKHSLGQPVYLGDVSRPKLLHRVHACAARAIVLTMDHPDATLNAASAIHKEFPHTPLLARAHDEQHAKTLLRAGATWVTPETLEAGLQLSAFVLETLGIERAQVAEAIRKERAMRLGQVNDRRNAPA
jgi:CPA2 family monovalent cation:H+ antiporter-2